MAFDIDGALKAGYSKSEVADFLASEKKFDITAAREAGYSDDDILGHLNPKKSVLDRVKETASDIGQGMVDLMPSRSKPTQADYDNANRSTQKLIDEQHGTDQPDLAKNLPNVQPSDRTTGETLTDAAASFGKGAGSTVRAAGWLAKQLPGGRTATAAAEQLGIPTPEALGKQAESFWASSQSDSLKASLDKVEKAEGFVHTMKVLAQNPDALADTVIQSMPMMVPGMAAGSVSSRVASSIGYRLALRSGMSQAAAEQVAEKVAMRFAVGMNVLGEGAMSAGSTGSTVEDVAKAHGASDPVATAAAREAAIKAGLWTAAGATLGAGFESRAMLGKLKEQGLTGLLKNVGKEMAEEAIQNPGEDYFQYQGTSKFDPNATFDPGKSVAIGIAAGGATGAGFHAAGRISSREEQKPTTMAEQRDSVMAAESVDDAIMAAAQAVDTPIPTAQNDRTEAANVQSELAQMAPVQESEVPNGPQPAATDAVLDTPSPVSPSNELGGSPAVSQSEPAIDLGAASPGTSEPGAGSGEAVAAGTESQPGPTVEQLEQIAERALTPREKMVPVSKRQPVETAVEKVKQLTPLNRVAADRIAKQYGDSAVVPHPTKPGMFAVVPADQAQAYAQAADPAVQAFKENTQVQSTPDAGVSSVADVAPANTSPEPVKETPNIEQIAGRTIDGDWTAFAPESGTLAVPRAEMPQIKAEHRGPMVNFLNARGIEHEEQTVPATSLKPTQAEFSRQKVEKAKAYEGGDRAILVSEDGHVLDGHHQWMAAREAGEDVRTIRLKAPIKELLKVVPEFPSATVDQQSQPKTESLADAAQAKGSVSAEENKPAEEPAAKGEPDSLSATEENKNARESVLSTPPVPEQGSETQPTAKWAAQAPVARSTQPQITDFGEKIGGARKDLWSGFKDDLSKVSDADIAGQPLSRVWPAPDYQALIDSGMDKSVVAFVRAVRDKVPAKPRSAWKVKRWAEQVKELRQLALDVMEGRTDVTEIRSKLDSTRNLQGLMGRMDLYEEFGHAKSLEGIQFGWHHYALYRGRENVTLWSIDRDSSATAFSNWPMELATGDTKEQAIENFRKVYDRLDAVKAVRKASFDVFSERKNGETKLFVGKKIGRNLQSLAGPFDTVKEARDYRENNLDELNARLEKLKEIPSERRDTNNPRVGEDMRNGQDVTPQMFAEAFGFRGVEFGNWVENNRRQKDLNDAYDALMDMAAILEIPPKAISLNGELGLAFGARGSGGKGAAAAHYERDRVVINLTKREGAGSLGHEWWHALDNYFSRMRAKSDEYATEALDVSLVARNSNFVENSPVRREMIEAFGAVIRAIKNTAIKARSSKLDAKRTKEYWTTGREMSARAFESYLISKLQDQNASNDYLANIVDEDTWKAAESLGFELDDSYPYPTAGEIPAIREGFQKLFDTIQSKETDKGTMLFSRGGDDLDFAASTLVELSAEDGLFSMPVSKASSLKGVFADVMPQAEYFGEHTREDERDESKADHRYVFTLPGQESDKTFYVYTTDDGRVWIDVSRLAQGDGGQKVYAAVANWAFNNRKKFVGDPIGLSADATIRRTSNMLASALRLGTTEHLEAAYEQEKGDQEAGIEPLEWRGNDFDKLKALIHTFVTTVENQFPALKAYRYDFTSNQYVDRSGRPVGSDRFADAGRSGVARAARAGEKTLRRAVFLRSLLGADPQTREEVTLRALSRARSLVAEGAGPLFSRGEQGGTTVEQVENWLAEPLAQLKNIPRVRIVADQFEIPEVEARLNSLRERAMDLDPAAAREIDSFFEKPVEGAYIDGQIWLVANSLKSKQRALEVLSHEAVGHLSVEQMLDASDPALMPKLLRQVQTLDRAGNPYIRQLAATVDRRQPDLPAENRAKEIIALIAERGDDARGPARSIYQRIIDGIKAFFKLAFDQNLSDQDVRDIVASARRWAEGEHVAAGDVTVSLEPSFSRADPTDSEAFAKWFGDSKVVDADGKPLVVYHGGTVGDVFDASYSGIGSGRESGFFFTPDIRQARDYAGSGSVKEVFLSIQNPLYTDHQLGPDEVAQAKADGHDGYWLIEDGLVEESEIVAFRPEQIKSAIGNNGDFDPESPNILFSRADTWAVNDPEDSAFSKSLGLLDTDKDSLIYTLQDKHIDTKRVVQAIKKTIGDIADKWNPYLQEELYHGRAAKRVKDFLDKELRPLLQDMQMRGIAMSDFEEYLWNRHAEERNNQIAKINPDMQDGGSGLKTADARKYLRELPESRKRAFDALTKRIDQINRNTRQGLVDAGLETQETIDNWEAAYEHYVPLQREDVETGGTGTGRGFSIRGSSTKRAIGSNKRVADIIANIAQQRERAIVRAEKNRVSNALMGLAIQNPNPDFWTVDTAPKERVVEGDKIVERTVPGFIGRDNVVSTRVNGQDHYIVFNENDERAMRMALSMKNMDADQLGRILSVTGKVTRYFAAINTQYNPIFGMINLTRDTQGALLNLSTTPLAGQKKKVLGYAIPAIRGIYAEARAQRKGNETDSTWAKLYEEFQREGGQTGYRDQFADAKERARAIEKEIKQISDGNLKKLGRGMFNWLSDYNETMENGIRLAAYRAALEQGMTKQQAASLAKNLTVNFNRKGQIATQAGALYAFFNASMQGTARLAETLKGPAGKKIIAGGILLGAMQALLLAMAGMDDDEPPEFVKERALILPIGNGKYLSLPMPLGFHVLVNMGRIPTEFVINGFRDPGKRVLDLMGVLADTFNPIGNAGMSLQTLTPTALDPLAALSENKDWTGKPIYKENMRALAPEPGYARAKDTASELSKSISYWLNIASGGTKYKPGLVSPTPDQLDYLIGQATGGVGREYLKAEQTAASAITGEEMPMHKIPLVGRFIGDTKGQSSETGKFYEAIKRLNEHEAEIKGLRKEGKGREAAEYLRDNPEARLIQQANAVERQLSDLRAKKRQALEKGQKDRVQVLDRMITNRIHRFNEQLNALEDKQAA